MSRFPAVPVPQRQPAPVADEIVSTVSRRRDSDRIALVATVGAGKVVLRPRMPCFYPVRRRKSISSTRTKRSRSFRYTICGTLNCIRVHRECLRVSCLTAALPSWSSSPLVCTSRRLPVPNRIAATLELLIPVRSGHSGLGCGNPASTPQIPSVARRTGQLAETRLERSRPCGGRFACAGVGRGVAIRILSGHKEAPYDPTTQDHARRTRAT